MKTLLSTLAAVAMLSTGALAADAVATKKPAASTTAATSSSTTTPAKAKTATVQSEKSKKCSSEADAKHLHGKERKAFRKECLKSA